MPPATHGPFAPVFALVSAVSLLVPASFGPAFAQAESAPEPLLEVVVTPNRSPEAIQQSGSAVTVISTEDIAKSNPGSLADVLRGVPGLALTEQGGPGKLAYVTLRGAEARHTLVLIDGIRVNDPSVTDGPFDFSNLVATDIERIEVLRGPQSALYGSDAIGGVINIITKKGRGAPKASLTLEGGSYRTGTAIATVSGGTERLSYAFALAAGHSDGFSAYGYRIKPLVRAYGPLDKDGYDRVAGTARLSFRASDTLTFEAGLYSGRVRGGYDAAFAGFGYLPDTPSMQTNWLTTIYGRAILDSFDGRLRNQLTVYANRTERTLDDWQRYDFGFGLTNEHNRNVFVGNRYGVEYQGDLKLDRFGKLTFGAGVEAEDFSSRTLPGLNSFNAPSSEQHSRLSQSLFALHQITLFDRLDLSLGGRVDNVGDTETFVTGRATAAYRIAETGTKLRASLGTGAKAPSLYQQFSIYGPTQNGDPALRPEHSVGVYAGIDQDLFDARVKLSATVFANRLRDLIDFDFTRGLPGMFGPMGQYINVGRARSKGVELSGEAVLWPGYATLKASYTYLDARDATTDEKLARRPVNQGKLALALTPLDRLTIEPVLYLVGARFSSPKQQLKLAPYARLDLNVNYKIDERFTVFGRAENLTNAHYQEIATYGTTGRAFYAGVKAAW
jgi:vitamin B12 transporter